MSKAKNLNMRVKCIIIDDDRVFTKILEHYISKIDFLEHQQTYYNSAEAFNKIDTREIDLIFLDMEMPEMNGLEFLEALSEKPALVFVSRNKAYGPEAFENNALDYLHKPILLNRFLKCSAKIKDYFEKKTTNLENKNGAIFIKHDGLWQKISVHEIGYIKADNNNIIVVTDYDKHRTNIKLKDIIDKLPEGEFMQVHRSYIVQLNKINKVDGEIIEINNKTIPVSKPYVDALYKRLNLK